MAYDLDLSQRPEDVLLNSINYENPGLNLTWDKCYLDPYGPRISTRAGYDTLIYVYFKPASGIQGKASFYYKRIDLTERLDGSSIQIAPDEYVTTKDLLPLVLSSFGINLGRKDIYDDYIFNDRTDNKIRISALSVLYKGHIPISLIPPLLSRVSNPVLDGFNKP